MAEVAENQRQSSEEISQNINLVADRITHSAAETQQLAVATRNLNETVENFNRMIQQFTFERAQSDKNKKFT